MFSAMVAVMMVVWQHVVFDPAPVLDTLISNNAHRAERRAGRYRRGNLDQRMVPCMAAGLQLSAVPDSAERQAPARASRPPDCYARARPCGFLFE
jgi:hypothetical protein